MPAYRQHLSGSGQVSQFAAQVADIHIHRAFGMAADGGLAVSDKGGKRFARHRLAVRLAQAGKQCPLGRGQTGSLPAGAQQPAAPSGTAVKTAADSDARACTSDAG